MNETATKRQKYWNKQGKDGPWDYNVIGSGMGGMTSAAMLARLGKRVLVLEQHYVPGGFTHMFRRKGYIWDVGVHAVGEVTRHSMTGRLLAALTEDRLKWQSLGPVYDEFYFPEGFRIDFPDNPKQFRDNLIAAFPDEQAAIDAYLDEVKKVSASMKGYYLARTFPKSLARPADLLLAGKARAHLDRTTAEVIAELTDNPRLRTIFAAQWGYYGSVPSRSSFAIQALVVKHFLHGGYYPVGGAREIANELLKTVAEAGGWTRINADVEEILVRKGRVVGVRLAGGEEIEAKNVISAAGIGATVSRLLPEEHRNETWARDIAKLRPASAHVCLYLGFKGDIRTAGAGPANKWFYQTWDCELDAWNVHPDQELPKAPILYCSFPSLKDPEHDPGPDQRHTGEVVTFVPWEAFGEWEGSRWMKRGESYESFKKQLEEHLLEQFLKHMPQLEPMLDYVELSTPLSTDTFCRPQSGSIYGLEPTPERFGNKWLRARAPIGGLFFSGSEVASVGVIGAMMGGVLAAASAEPVAAWKFMKGDAGMF